MEKLEKLQLKVPALHHASLAEIQSKFGFITSIEEDNSIENKSNISIIAVIDSQNPITPKEYMNTIPNEMGYQHMMWCNENQNDLPSLLLIMKENDRSFIDFPGTIAIDKGGNRVIPYLQRVQDQWTASWHSVERAVDNNGRVAVEEDDIKYVKDHGPKHI